MSVTLQQQQRFAKVRQTRLCTQIMRQVGQACICQLYFRMRNKALSLHFQKALTLSPCVSSWFIPDPALACICGAPTQRSRALTPTPPTPSEPFGED